MTHLGARGGELRHVAVGLMDRDGSPLNLRRLNDLAGLKEGHDTVAALGKLGVAVSPTTPVSNRIRNLIHNCRQR